jgi:REP element-mobilizing transposase RayT
MKKIFQKRTRLKDFNYKGYYTYYVTICTDYRKIHFNNEEHVNLVLEKMKEISYEYSFIIIIYCFMPDHLHILAKGESEESDFLEFMKTFKQITGFYFKKKFEKSLWQENYFEHVLRSNEDVFKIAGYILENPMRKGLVEDPFKYKYTGSLKYKLEDLF